MYRILTPLSKTKSVFYTFVFFLTSFLCVSNVVNIKIDNFNDPNSSKLYNYIFDQYPLFIRTKTTQETNLTFFKKRILIDIDCTLNKNLELNLIFLKLSQLYHIVFIYIYKKPFCLFSRPPPNILII